MPFKAELKNVVYATNGGVGAVFVDEEGEAVDHYTRGDAYDIKLAGAHQSVLLAAVRESLKRMGNNNSVQAMTIRSERFTYNVAPVTDGYFLVLVQNSLGLPSAGLQAVKDAVPRIARLI